MKTITILSSPITAHLSPGINLASPNAVPMAEIFNDDSSALSAAELEKKSKFATSFFSINHLETKVDSDTLSKNLKDFLNNLKPVLIATDEKVGNFSIKEVELRLAVSANGGINLIGVVNAGIEASITIKLSKD